MTEAKDEELISLAVSALSIHPFIHSNFLGEVEKRRLLRFFWIAFLATYIVRGRPSLMPHDLEDMMASQMEASRVAVEHLAAQALTASNPLTIIAVRSFLKAIHEYPQCRSFFMHVVQLCLRNTK